MLLQHEQLWLSITIYFLQARERNLEVSFKATTKECLCTEAIWKSWSTSSLSCCVYYPVNILMYGSTIFMVTSEL